ncbi:MAG: hypothetical protein ACK5KT_11385 [Dysgonomonas sp.]
MAKQEQQKERGKHPFVLLDESVTTYGFRVLTDGVDISQFQRNPVFLIYHADYKLPAGRCSNIRKENKQILVDVEFDYEDTDEEVQRIIGKYERGFLRMVSAGLADLDISDDEIYKIEGQSMPTIVKSRLREVSAVGIGGNHNALRLYDNDGAEIDISNEIKLTDFIKPYKQVNQMNKELLTVLNLADNANDAAVIAAIVALKDSNTTLISERDGLKTKLDALELADKTAKRTEAGTLVTKAVQDGRINDDAEKTVSKKWLELFDKDHEGTKVLLAGLPTRQPVVEQIDKTKQGNATELADLNAKSWDELDRSGKLITLRDKYPDVYAAKYEQEFKKKPNT